MHWHDECDDGEAAIERLTQHTTMVAFIWLL